MEDTDIFDEKNLLKSKLKKEIDNLIISKWDFLDNNWPKIYNKYNHRTEIKDIKKIKFIKTILLKELGYIPVFYFLTVLYGTIEYPGPYKEIEKGLVLLYHIISGKPGCDMNEFIPYTTFYALYKKFWITNKNKLKKQIEKDISTLFSNIKIRILSAKVNNPETFKNITMIIDGHDGKIKYYNPIESNKTLYSYKLKGPGLRTQIVSDMNEMIILISKSEKCAKSNDGIMFLNMKLHNKIHKGDCLAMDGGYTLFIDKFKEMSINEGYDFQDKNFVYPIRKETGINLTANELHSNKVFGSFRSAIENQFSVLASKFDRFNNNSGTLQITDIEIYNVQFKTACLLKNLWNAVDKFDIEVQPHHMLWYNDDYEFPSKNSKLKIVYTNEYKQNQENINMNKLQEEILKLDLEDTEYMEIDDDINDESQVEDLEISKKRKHKKVSVVIEQMN
ncbi:unnamed protein product [Mucor hiemalis]